MKGDHKTITNDAIFCRLIRKPVFFVVFVVRWRLSTDVQ